MILIPSPFDGLVRRLFTELDEHQSIFDLPARRMVLAPGADLAVSLHGLPAATPFGPAAGPHTQLAQNIVLSWLAGGRIIELKTVQVRDDLQIPRPCIDMATRNFNIEWSQELRLEESLEEYVKALVLIRVLIASQRLPVPADFVDTIFDVSVGYDLAGLRSPRVEAFLDGVAHITPLVDRLRARIPREYAAWADVEVPSRLAASATLSTFHGCPPGEIGDMARHLMTRHGLHTIVKLNPTLLGPLDTRRLLGDVLGYDDLHVPDTAFANDTTWDQMVDLVGGLREDARRAGVGFGIKLTNTLIVENHGTFFPSDARDMYMSGPPLHVLATELLRRVRGVFGPDLPISFSAGIDATNFADALSLGLTPVTACSDLLQPGGYGRAWAYFQHVRDRFAAAHVDRLGDFIIVAGGHAEAALDRVPLEPHTRDAARSALRRDDAGPLGLHERLDAASYVRWQREAAMLNAVAYAERAQRDPRYRSDAHRKPPKKIGRRLQLFDCLTCDKCIPVCPNDAIFTLALPRQEWVRLKLVPDGDGWRRIEDGVLRVAEKHQIAIFSDFCNECGNCDVFCPEDGGPYALKPLLFGSETAFKAAHPADGFFVSTDNGHERVLGRFKGREYRVDLVDHEVRFQSDGFDVSFDEDDPDHTIRGDVRPDTDVDLVYFYIMRSIAQAVYAPGAVNYIKPQSSRRGLLS